MDDDEEERGSEERERSAKKVASRHVVAKAEYKWKTEVAICQNCVIGNH